MKGTTKRIISVILTVLMLSVPLYSVYAEGGEPVKLALAVASQSVRAGQSFRMNVRLEFEDSFPAAAGGISIMKWNLKFDPDRLDILDPYTMEALSFDSNGAPSNGSLYRFGELGTENYFETRTNDAGNGIVMLYAAENEDGYIDRAGDFVQFAFRPKLDLAINEQETVLIEAAESSVLVNNKDVKLDVSGDLLQMNVTPFFSVPKFAAQKQNSTLTVSGRSGVIDSGRTITVDISKNGEVIESKSATLGSALYGMDFELDEARYPVGLYTLTFTSGNSTTTRVLEVVAKDTEIIEPTDPDDPDDPNDPDDPDDPLKPDNPSKPGEDDKPGNTGGNTGGNSGSGSSSGGSSSGDKKPADTNAGTPAGTTPSDSVQYPSDIAGHWAADYIEYVYDHKLMNGYEDGSFVPEGNITRAEFSAVMARFLDIKGDDNAAANFADVDGHWAKPYIDALAAAKIVGGVSDTEFEPDAEITREQIAVILSRAFGLTTDIQSGIFTDEAAISGWARSGVYAVATAGYMQGNDNGSFSPLSEATRAEVATVISRIHSQKQ